MTIENNPPLGIYPPNIINEPEPEPEPELINALVNNDNNIIVTYNYAINPTDWIGIYTGDSDFFYLWCYVGGTQTPSDTGNGVLILNESNSLNDNTIEFPLLVGEYKVAFFIDDSYDIYGDILYLTIEPEPIENNPPLGNYPPNIVNDWPPSIATDDSITVLVNNYYDKQIIKIHLGSNISMSALDIGWGEEFKSNQELVDPAIHTEFYLNNATNNIDFDNFYNIENINSYDSFTNISDSKAINFIRLTGSGITPNVYYNFIEITVNQQYNILNEITIFKDGFAEWGRKLLTGEIIMNEWPEGNTGNPPDDGKLYYPSDSINTWRAQQPTVNYIFTFNPPQNIFVNPSPNIPIVIYIENNGIWSQALLDDERYEYTIRFSVFYYQNDDWRDNLNNLINNDVFNLMTYTTPGNIVSNSENNINYSLISTSSGANLPNISNRHNINGVIMTMTTINNSSTYPSPVNYFTSNINYAQYIINIQTILYDNIDNLSNFVPMGFLMGNPINTSTINIILLPEITTDLLDNLRHIKINEKYYNATSSSPNYGIYTVNIDKTITENIDSFSKIYGNPINITPTPEFYNFQLLGVINLAVIGNITIIDIDLINFNNNNIETLVENLIFLRLDNKDTGTLLPISSIYYNTTFDYNEDTNILKISINEYNRNEYNGNIDRGTLVYGSRLNYNTSIPLSIYDIHIFKSIGRLLYKTSIDPNVNNNTIGISLFDNVDLNISLSKFYFIKIGNSETIFNVAGFNIESDENFSDMFRINLSNGNTESYEVGSIVYGSLIERVNIPFTEYKLIGKIQIPFTNPVNEIIIELIPEINIQKSFDNFNFIIIDNENISNIYTVLDYNLVNRNNSNILRIVTAEIINNYNSNSNVYGYNILYVDPVIPENNTNNTDYVNTDPYQLTLTTCCPPKVHHGNGLRRSWTAGTFLIDGSHLNKARLCASRINNTIYGPIHGKPVFVKNNLNVYGRYAGFPGGSGAPIRNKF